MSLSSSLADLFTKSPLNSAERHSPTSLGFGMSAIAVRILARDTPTACSTAVQAELFSFSGCSITPFLAPVTSEN